MQCKWVRSDVDGCEWVRMGALGHRIHGGHINKARRGKNGRAGHISVAMAGEISPDIMFLPVCQKVV